MTTTTLARRVLSAVRRRVHLPVLEDVPATYRAAIFVAGSGRSGTTWLSELLIAGTRRRYLFEPLSRNVAITTPFHRDFVKRYLRPDADEPELREIMDRVLSGQIRSRWTERFNRRLRTHGRVVKEIRANLMLGWLQATFPGLPVILMLRHPCAVAASFAREGWRGRVGEMLAQPELVRDHLNGAQCDVLVELERSPLFERAIGIWCVETMVALRQMRRGAYVLCYESLLTAPAYQLGKLFAWLERSDVAAAIERVARPSSTSRGDRITVPRLTAWQHELTGAQIARALEVVKAFDLDMLYGAGPLPDLRVPLEPWLS